MAGTDSPAHDRSAIVKDRIRRSARKLFTRDGFDATGIRDIALDAGVNPAIIIRHFGSKGQLFLDTVDGAATWKALLGGSLDELGREVVRALLAGRKSGLQIFGATVRASAHPDIHDRLQRSIADLFATPLAQRITGPDARLRAHLFAAQLTGLMIAFSVYDDEYLATVPAQEIIDRYGDSLQRFVDG